MVTAAWRSSNPVAEVAEVAVVEEGVNPDFLLAQHNTAGLRITNKQVLSFDMLLLLQISKFI